MGRAAVRFRVSHVGALPYALCKPMSCSTRATRRPLQVRAPLDGPKDAFRANAVKFAYSGALVGHLEGCYLVNGKVLTSLTSLLKKTLHEVRQTP